MYFADAFDRDPSNENAFRHVLTRDVAYGQIPRAQRAEKHRRAAEWIESLSADRENAPDMLAHHYSSALELADDNLRRAFGLDPDLAIVVDVTHATDQPGVELGQVTTHKLGSGPVIARGTSLHPAVTELLHETAEQEELPFTVESLGRGTGTDADAVHATRTGIPTGLVSVPLRYMHSSVELVSLGDIEAAAKLISAFAQRLAPGMSFER